MELPETGRKRSANPADLQAAPASASSGRTAAGWVITALTLVILYGSWIPFDLDLSRLGLLARRTLPPLGFPGSDLDDLLVNLLVYAPLGAAMAMRREFRCSIRGLPVLRAAAYCAVVSFTAETVQSLSAVRMASWIDVGVNTCGGALGAYAAALTLPGLRLAVARVRDAFLKAPLKAGAAAMSVLFVLAGLSPFDFVPNTLELHDRFLDAEWRIGAALPRDEAQLLSVLLPLSPLMIACGCLALARASEGKSRTSAVLSAAKHGVALGVVVEVFQVFVVSQKFEAGGIAMAMGAGLIGACLSLGATALADRGQAASDVRLNRAFIPALALLLGAALVSPATGGGATRGLFSAEGLRSLRFLPPFEEVWRLSTAHAAGALTGMAVTQSLSVLLLMAVLGGRRVARRSAPLIVGCGLVSLAIQFGRNAAAATIDLTAPVLALGVAMVLTRAYVALRGGALTVPSS